MVQGTDGHELNYTDTGGIGLHLCVEGQCNYVIISYLEGDGE